VKSGDTVSINLLHFEDVCAVIGRGQPIGLNSDADGLRGLSATIRGVWLIEDGRPVKDPDDAQQEASFYFF
jgi:hypothetical protein